MMHFSSYFTFYPILLFLSLSFFLNGSMVYHAPQAKRYPGTYIYIYIYIHIVHLSLLTMTNPNQMCGVLLFVCSKMADETNLSSKLPAADRTREV